MIALYNNNYICEMFLCLLCLVFNIQYYCVTSLYFGRQKKNN